jgi:hypothetical protein
MWRRPAAAFARTAPARTMTASAAEIAHPSPPADELMVSSARSCPPEVAPGLGIRDWLLAPEWCLSLLARCQHDRVPSGSNSALAIAPARTCQAGWTMTRSHYAPDDAPQCPAHCSSASWMNIPVGQGRGSYIPGATCIAIKRCRSCRKVVRTLRLTAFGRQRSERCSPSARSTAMTGLRHQKADLVASGRNLEAAPVALSNSTQESARPRRVGIRG